MSFSYPELGHLIDGRWMPNGDRKGEPVFNPSSGEILATVPHVTDADLAAALESAERGFAVWRDTSAMQRANILRRASSLIRARTEEIAYVVASELGKPLAEARAEVDTAAGIFEWNADEGRRTYGRVIPSRAANVLQLVVKEPIGPVAAFAPWNAPAITPSRKISSALAAGCSVIIKPSEETPGTAVLIARCLQEAGLPPGVLGLVFGDPHQISTALLSSPTIAGFTFTGSTEVGRRLAALGLTGMKRSILELGGHAPVIVCDDVDPAKVATAAVGAKYRNAGQICTSPTRFYVQESVYHRFVDAFSAGAGSVKVGRPLDSSTQMGPLANSRRVKAMENFVEDALRRGIRITSGGSRIIGGGNFFTPTVLADATNECMAANVEPFGPLALIQPFTSLDEAIAAANRLPVGLAAYAATHDSTRANLLQRRIRSGTVAINHWQVSLPETPFGGWMDSGVGQEGGIEGLEPFQRIKNVSQAA